MRLEPEAGFGAVPLGDGRVSFRVWAPSAASVAVELNGSDLPLERGAGGVWHGELEAEPGDDYRYVLDGEKRLPDPCSRAQPEGIRGPSRVVDTASFEIAPPVGLSLDGLVVYELHVKGFTMQHPKYGPGHHLHPIHANQVAKRPWGWRAAVVRDYADHRFTVDYLTEDGSLVG